MTHTVTLIPGDGTGPELAAALETVIAATGVPIDWEVHDAGVDVMEEYGTPLPEHVLESIRRTKVAIKGPITTPVGNGFRSVNVALRKELDLYACLRPSKTMKGVRSRYDDIDLVDRAREHRGPLRRHRAHGRATTPPRASRSSRARAASASCASPSSTRARTAAARSPRCTRPTS